MNTKHTPGPWEVRGLIITKANPQSFSDEIAALATCKEEEANARLIAAAPELLEACREAESLLRWYISDIDRINDDESHPVTKGVQQLRYAIKKATE